MDNSNHLLERQTRKSLWIFCCIASKYAVPYQKKAQKYFGISFLLPTCVASFCASIYYIPWLPGSLLAGTLPSGISRLSEAFGEWKGISLYFCHSAMALVGRVSLGFQISSNHILSLHTWEASPAWSAHLHRKQQPTISWFSCGIFEVPPIFVWPSHVIKCVFIILCKPRQFVVFSALLTVQSCVSNSGGPASRQPFHIFGMHCFHVTFFIQD